MKATKATVMENSTVALMAPVGPVAEGFVNDQRFITAIMGPYGSAKTTSCIRKILTSLVWMNRGPDGVRRARWCVVRDTYQQLETNVLNSWFTWFPKTKENWNGREMCHRLRWTMQYMDGREAETFELEMYFRAMGDQKAEQVLKGLELTGLWLNEVDTLDPGVLRFGLPRTGRYPSAKDGGCAWSGVIADFNAPDIDNWTYELLVDKQLPIDDETVAEIRKEFGPRFGIGFWQQPGGRSVDPKPENIHNLEKGYYQKLMIGLTPNDIRRFIDNEFGAVRNGQPVYPEYNDDFHCAKEPLRAMPGLPVCMGIDGGSTPAAVFGQRTDLGQIRTIDEVVIFQSDETKLLEQLGPRAFGRTVRRAFHERHPNASLGMIWADPACWYGENDEYSWIKEFEKGFNEPPVPGAAHLRVKVKPAPVKGNRLTERLEIVRAGFVNNPGGQPGQLISPACRHLRRGFKNGYVIQRVQLSHGTGRWKDEPVKNDWSHSQDAKQYLDAGLVKSGAMALSDLSRSPRADARRTAKRRKFGTGYFSHREAG